MPWKRIKPDHDAELARVRHSHSAAGQRDAAEVSAWYEHVRAGLVRELTDFGWADSPYAEMVAPDLFGVLHSGTDRDVALFLRDGTADGPDGLRDLSDYAPLVARLRRTMADQPASQ